MSKYILGIDQGTTGSTIYIFDKQANIISSAYKEITQYFPQDGWVEHDAMEIWTTTLALIKEALKKAKLTTADIAAIGITNQRETTVFWDKKTGVPVTRAIVWQDRRTLEICERLIALDKKGIEDRCGFVIIPNAAATKIAWLLENDETVRRGVDNHELLYGTMDTWLVWNLTGGKVHVTDHTNCSNTLLLNELELGYDDFIIETLKIPRHILPELKSASDVFGYTDTSVLEGVSVPIAGIGGDQQCAAFGQACLKPGMAKNTYGTGSFMVMNTGEKYVLPQEGIFSEVLCNPKGIVQYGMEALCDVSGAVIQWLRDGLGIISESGEAEQLAMQVPDNGGVYFVPAFVGVGAPYFDSYARGTIFGITRGTTKQHVARAALESMAYQVADSFSIMARVSGLELTALRADGGGAKSDFLMQFQADLLGVPVERPVVTETTVLGAAYLAGLAVGYYDGVDDITRNWRLERAFEPQISEDQRQELRSNWTKAIQRASGWLKN